jgi:hypothetical protein
MGKIVEKIGQLLRTDFLKITVPQVKVLFVLPQKQLYFQMSLARTRDKYYPGKIRRHKRYRESMVKAW